MTVMSYIAYPTELGNEHLFKELSKIDGCDVELSEDKKVLILVTTTENKADEERIKKELEEVKSLSCMALVYAGNEEDLIGNNL
jgi:nitrate reductase NapAB chaperone NapD